MPKKRPEEQEAVNTTIVGGRPPGCGKPVGQIPRGIEVLVKKAAVDPEFRDLLLEKREAAAEEIGLRLEPAETMMMKAVPEKQLLGIIEQTHVPEQHRSVFLGRVAAAMLIALGVTVVTGCPSTVKGTRPEPIQPDRVQNASEEAITPKPPQSRGIRPDKPRSKGIRPDRPEKSAE